MVTNMLITGWGIGVSFWDIHQKMLLNSTKKQLNNGWMHGTVSKNAIELSEKISKAVPVAEKIRYASTGTEATMYATDWLELQPKEKP